MPSSFKDIEAEEAINLKVHDAVVACSMGV